MLHRCLASSFHCSSSYSLLLSSCPFLCFAFSSFLICSFPLLCFAFSSFPFCSFALLCFQLRSCPFLSFPFLSFPFFSFLFLSFSLLSAPFLCFPFLLFPFLSNWSSIRFRCWKVDVNKNPGQSYCDDELNSPLSFRKLVECCQAVALQQGTAVVIIAVAHAQFDLISPHLCPSSSLPSGPRWHRRQTPGTLMRSSRLRPSRSLHQRNVSVFFNVLNVYPCLAANTLEWRESREVTKKKKISWFGASA